LHNFVLTDCIIVSALNLFYFADLSLVTGVGLLRIFCNIGELFDKTATNTLLFYTVLKDGIEM
jgi:hypothetical protein